LFVKPDTLFLIGYSKEASMLKKINLAFIIILLITATVTYFLRNNYKNISAISPETLKPPIQKAIRDLTTITFTKDQYEYVLTPLFSYEINALITHEMDYRLFSIYKRDSVFPLDLCLIWGENISGGIFKDRSLAFSQDMRYCSYSYSGRLNFNNNEFSNNHLIVNDPETEKKISSLSTGDQIKIKGKLVNVSATNLGQPGEFDPEYFQINSSTQREDSGVGACEVIYVESIDILEKGNPILQQIFQVSFLSLISLLALNILMFVIGIFIEGYRH